jgi:hypothetical protein
MKKLLAVILILALLLPAFVLAETDPIVGYWYMYIDMKAYPELVTMFGDYDHILSMFYFDESGFIYQLENDVKDRKSTPYFTSGGKWEKSAAGYNVSIIGIGETTMIVDGDTALLKNKYASIYLKVRKLVPFNPYTDFSQ